MPVGGPVLGLGRSVLGNVFRGLESKLGGSFLKRAGAAGAIGAGGAAAYGSTRRGGLSSYLPSVSQLVGGAEGERKKHKRINPLNARAARRAVRRLKGVHRLLTGIERNLPRRPAKGKRLHFGKRRRG